MRRASSRMRSMPATATRASWTRAPLARCHFAALSRSWADARTLFFPARVDERCRDAAVGLAKRDAFLHDERVRGFGRTDRRIETDLVRPKADRIDRRRQDAEGRPQRIDGTKERRFQELQIALIPRWQLCGNAEGLHQARVGEGGASAHELEEIRISLLRHDR